MNVLDVQLAKGDQDVIYREVLIIEGRRLRIYIRSNSYRFQCQCYIEHWDGGQWREVHTISPFLMATKEGLSYGRTKATDEDFNDDRTKLLNIATQIIF